MPLRTWIFSLLLISTLFELSCRKKSNPTPQLASGKAFVLPSDSVIEILKSKPIPEWAPKKFSYKPSAERTWDLLHTSLDVSFDWARKYMPATAELTLEPYFYPQQSLVLDARGFDLHSVEIKLGNRILKHKQEYDGKKIRLSWDESLSKGQQILVKVAYTAKPDELPVGGSAAITRDKGLFFINPNKEEPGKPQQIWTQGEPQSASCWFPTIDAPNERCTQKIAITVEDRFKTLSNGLKIASKKLPGGMRKDVWEMKLPHAPYLFMMAVGEFAVVTDQCDGLPMAYWVEPSHEKLAKKIFGRTPEMIRFFSRKLGCAYPWPKYDQVVVRDFVSGAMENTSASVFMEALQSTEEELVDRDWDDIIAHELFHQWFGDLVTLESWANLPMNESFANYSQYLWDEYRKGRDEADYNGFRETQQYFYEAGRKREPMIRYFHNEPDDMFDSHSYAKGGRLLHMLRKELGDEAFFAGLSLHLNRNAFKPVEIHHLRLALEEVSGRDLKWFFDQWFMEAGHPELEVKVQYQPGKVQLKIKQKQDTAYFPVYRLRIPLEIWEGSECRQEVVYADKLEQVLEFPVKNKADLLLWNADASLLASVEMSRKPEELEAQFRLAGLAYHRLEALQGLQAMYPDMDITKQVYRKGLKDSFWAIRYFCVDALSELDSAQQMPVLGQIKALATSDPHPRVRATAVKMLGGMPFEGKQALLQKAIQDSSQQTSGQAYKAYLKENYPDAKEKVDNLQDKGDAYNGVLAEYYANRPELTSYQWFTNQLSKAEPGDSYEMVQAMGRMLIQSTDSMLVNNGLQFLFKQASSPSRRADYVISVYQVLKSFQMLPGIRQKRQQIREIHKDSEFAEVLNYLE
jgi:aminopeptidase N